MKWTEISIQTSHEATEAVANIFHDLGASGVVIEDPELINSYRRSGTWDDCAIPEEDDTEIVTVKAYLPFDSELEDKLRVFETRINELSLHDLDKGSGAIKLREVRDEDWENSWKRYYHPVKIGERIVVKPSWEEYTPMPEDLVIELDPGMAFGTGTHYTTVLCAAALEDTVVPGNLVYDIGTGSGILAVAAALLGADQVFAVDNDVVALDAAQENVDRNQVSERVQVLRGDLLKGLSEPADVIVANIIADVIIRLAPDVPARLKDSGRLVVGGIIADRLSDVTAAIEQSGLVVEKVAEAGGWVTMIARKGGA